jgi:signal transduction histidine kinase
MNFSFDIFKNIPPLGHLYFFYGLSFFFLGFTLMVAYKKSSELIIASSIWLLAAFGCIHGIYVWIELFLLLQKKYIMESQIYLLNGMKILLFIISFLFLIQFGLVLTCHTIKVKRRILLIAAVPLILLFVWAASLWYQRVTIESDFLNAAYMSARYIFVIAGALLTAYGLCSLSLKVKDLSSAFTKKIFYAGIFFAFFGIAAGIVPSFTVLPYVYTRIEVVRILLIFLITFFILKALNIFDIETKRKLEKQVKHVEQADRLISIGRLAAGIAHEINNPLANASLNAEILKNRLKDTTAPEILTRLNAMENNIQKAATIAKELLQFSRKTEPHVIPVNINNIIRGSLSLMHHKFKGMNVNTNLSGLPEIIGDPIRLEQVMINILDNAHQAMRAGDEVRIESSLHNGSIKINIMDSGKGISPESLPKVFDPFFTTKEVGMGTGLGLSICYAIINQHKGDIFIESKKGEGTTVTIALPVFGINGMKNEM